MSAAKIAWLLWYAFRRGTPPSHGKVLVISTKPILCILYAVAALAIGAVALAQSTGGKLPGTSTEWPTYGHDSGGMRFSPVTQITPANVARLKVAWVYHMKPAGATAPAPSRGPVAGAGDTPEGTPVRPWWWPGARRLGF